MNYFPNSYKYDIITFTIFTEVDNYAGLKIQLKTRGKLRITRSQDHKITRSQDFKISRTKNKLNQNQATKHRFKISSTKPERKK
jgi:hypothetical protein